MHDACKSPDKDAICILVRRDTTCQEAAKRNIRAVRSVWPSTSNKATKSAERARKKPSVVHGPLSTRKPTAGKRAAPVEERRKIIPLRAKVAAKVAPANPRPREVQRRRRAGKLEDATVRARPRADHQADHQADHPAGAEAEDSRKKSEHSNSCMSHQR